MVNDPFTFGAISTVNSLSDVYAMGGKPLTALAIAGFPSCDLGPEVMVEILKGSLSILNCAGVQLMGGHSFDEAEIRFGLSVTGTVHKDKILRQRGAAAGDIIILTKPLGIGILTTALKGKQLSEKDIETAITWMLTLNDRASEAALKAEASAATDVTGFGLLGHAYTMVSKSDIDFIIDHACVPVLERTKDMLARGMVPGGAYRNLKHLENKVEYAQGVSEEHRILFADPQTSGGLLITLRENKLNSFKQMNIPFTIIGKVEKGKGKIRVV